METDVLIVGAGPSGLMLAVELGRQGIDCVVLERQLTRMSRTGGLALNPRSLELLDAAGVLAGCLDRSLKLRGTRLFTAGGRSRDVPFDRGGHKSTYNEVRILHQSVLESELCQRANEFDRHVHPGISFVGFSPKSSAQRLVADLVSSQGDEMSASCRFVVGCDGPYSSVRQAAGIEFPGRTLDWIYSIGEFQVTWDLPADEILEFLGQDRLLVVLPLPTPGRFRLTTWEPAPPSRNPNRVEHGPLVSPPTQRDFQEVVDQLVPFPTVLRSPENLYCYRVARRLADRLRAGRVCLAGDASRAFPPATALGMNLGLEDAHVLAGKIAAGGDDSLLESYHDERYAASVHALVQTEGAMKELTSAVLENDPGSGHEQDILMERWSPHERFLSGGASL